MAKALGFPRGGQVTVLTLEKCIPKCLPFEYNVPFNAAFTLVKTQVPNSTLDCWFASNSYSPFQEPEKGLQMVPQLTYI